MKSLILSAGLSLDYSIEPNLLSFSKIEVDGKKHLIQVVKIEGENVFYKDISHLLKDPEASPFELFAKHSFDDLKKTEKRAPLLQSKYSALRVAFPSREQHLCAGLNYADHVRESGQANKIVLFPKHGKVTTHNSVVPFSREIPQLLDYEIELGAIFDRAISSPEDLQDARAAFFIANDFSDRAPQIYFYGDDPNLESDSFAAAKSKKGYSIISPLLVIPRDWKTFAKNLSMKLAVNGHLKQESNTSFMSLSFEEMLTRALNSPPTLRWPLLKNDNSPFEMGEGVPLLPVDKNGKTFLPAHTIFMTGTPGGTLFQKPGYWDLFKAFLRIPTLDSSFQHPDFKKRLKTALIENWSRSGKFLKAGDLVESKIDQLGVLNFKVEAHSSKP